MFCINCGKKIPDDAIFCKYCGYCVSPPETSTNEVKKSFNPNIVIASIISVIVLLLLIKIGMPYFKIIHDGEKITISCNEQEDNTSDTDDIDSYDDKVNNEILCKHDVPIIHRRLEKAGIHNITSQIDGTMTILIGKKDMEDRADDIKQMISDKCSILLISESDAQTAGPEQLIDFSKVSGDNYVNDSDIKKAKAIKQKDKNGKTIWSVEITLDNWGRETFEKITKNNIDKYLNVYVDSVICSSAKVQAVITDGRFLISPAEGMSESEAKMLAAKINYRIDGEYFSTHFTVDNIDTEVTDSVIHYTSKRSVPYFDNEIEQMNKYIEDCGFVKREVHTGLDLMQLDVAMLRFSDHAKAGDGTTREMVEYWDGNPQMVFAFMSASLGDVKEFQKNSTDTQMTKFISNSETYGMQYWVDGLAKQHNTTTLDIPAIESNYDYYVFYIKSLLKQGYGTDEDISKVIESTYDNNLMNPQQFQEYQDCLYTIFYSFYEEEGIEDYYYILDTPEAAHARLAEDYSNFNYQPRKALKDN